MVHKPKVAPPPNVATTRTQHSVAFYETDAMGIVHHSNYVRFLEHARVKFLAEHDRPYTEYIQAGRHVPVTRVAVSYKRPCRFGDTIDITCWVAWARHASLGFAYTLQVDGVVVALAETDHAVVDDQGQPIRIPEHMRERLEGWLGGPPPRGTR